MKILVTSFEPFADDTLNSSQEALRGLPDTIEGAEIIKSVLPVTFGGSVRALRSVIRKTQPDIVLCLGMAGGRKALTPERIAINLRDARRPDNDGFQPTDETIFPDGPDAYFSTLPIKAMAAAITEAGVPAEISNTAGTYVCNQTMYGLMYILAHEFPKVRGGFMHLPYSAEMLADHPGEPGLPTEDLTRGIAAAVRAIISAV